VACLVVVKRAENQRLKQGDRLSEKPANVRKFDSSQGNVREFGKCQGLMGKIFSANVLECEYTFG